MHLAIKHVVQRPFVQWSIAKQVMSADLVVPQNITSVTDYLFNISLCSLLLDQPGGGIGIQPRAREVCVQRLELGIVFQNARRDWRKHCD